MDALIDSMRHHGLVGMAAPQIGKSERIFVTEVRKTAARKRLSSKDEDKLRVFINPTITSFSKRETKGWEGCGSVASGKLFGEVKRPNSVTVKANDRTGKEFEFKASNLVARVIQHEMDHLNGKVFTDKADAASYMSKNEYLKLRERTSKS